MEFFFELVFLLWPWRRVPNVVGMEAGKAWVVLVDSDLSPVGTAENASGRVAAQHPPAGTWRGKGRQVQVVLSVE